MRILLIDDSKTMRNIQKSVLKQLGYTEIEEACDGQDALSKIGAFKPELCLVDWNMPNMNGLELLQAIRKENANVPVIMITTEGSKAKVMDAVQNGASDYLVKPFTPAALKEKLAKWVTANA